MMFDNFETQPASGGAPPMQKGAPTNAFEIPSSPTPQQNDGRFENPTSPASPGYRTMNSPPTSPPAAASNPFDCFDGITNTTSPTSVAASGPPQMQQAPTPAPSSPGLQMPAMQQQQQQSTNPFESSFGAQVQQTQQPSAPQQQPPAQQQLQQQPPAPPQQQPQEQQPQQTLVQQPGAEKNLEYNNYSLGTQFQQPTAQMNQASPYGAYQPPVPPPTEAPPAPPSSQPSFDAPSIRHGNPVYDSNSWGATPQPSWGTAPAPSDLSSAPEQQQTAPAAAAPSTDPFGGAFGNMRTQAPSQPQQVPAQVNAPPPAALQPPAQQAQATDVGDDDFWSSMGFAAPAPASTPAAENNKAESKVAPAPKTPLTFEASGLPAGGETYHCRVHTSTLGVLFFKARDLKGTLYVNANEDAVKALGERPAVGHVFEGSAAEASGIGLGHILLSVNGQDASNPDHATHLIKTGERPLNLQVYAPPKEHVPVVTSEGKHQVIYNTLYVHAPPTKWDWKTKYVVVGGVIAKPMQMNMYYSKADYDTAVKETQSGLPKVSVKVKQFSLENAKLLYASNGEPKAVDYNETSWRYLVIQPQTGFPIKIAANSVGNLQPVHMGIKRAIEASRAQIHAAKEEAEYYYKQTNAGNNAYSSYGSNQYKGNVKQGSYNGNSGYGYDQFGGTDYYGQSAPGNSYEQNGGYNAAPPANNPYGNQPNWAQY